LVDIGFREEKNEEGKYDENTSFDGIRKEGKK